MSHERGKNWKIANVSLILVMLLIAGLYSQTLIYLTGVWNQIDIGEYAHGYLVLAISVYLILRNRRSLAGLTPCLTDP